MSPTPGVADHVQRVLIVDDERANRALLEAMLMPESLVLSWAANGVDALAAVEREAPDLILLDVMMPGMDGYEVARRVKSATATQNIPIIMVTALGDREAKLRGLESGVEDFLSKPVDRAELIVRMKNLLRLKAYGDYYGRYSELLERKVSLRTADLAKRTIDLEQHSVALRRNEERTNFALRAAKMGVWELDLESKALTCSATMAAVLGVELDAAPREIAGLIAAVHPDDRELVGQAIERASESGADFSHEFRVVWPDGSIRWLAGQARTMFDNGHRAVRLMGVGADIGERKVLESQLRQSQKMEAVGQLAGGVAHDFNNLLTVIMSYSELMLLDLLPADPHHDDITHVLSAAASAASLTRQLLAFSRKQVLQPTVLQVNQMVADVQGMLHRLIGGQVELVTALSDELGEVRADRGQLEQVLMNLVVNARDAMPAGGRLLVETENVDVTVPSLFDIGTPPGSYVVLSVRDSGTGMDEDTKERLFEPFFTTKEPGKGTGLGLATVYGIVQQSGGFISVQSEIGKGATFKVFLPRYVAQDPTDLAIDGVLVTE